MYAINEPGDCIVVVNMQNLQASGFYEHMEVQLPDAVNMTARANHIPLCT